MSDLLFEYKVRTKHRLGFKEFSFYATTDIDEFLNRNSIDYVRNATDTVENRLFKENKRLNNIINELEKYIVEEIDDAQEELNIILQGNNLDYKNECTKEFNCIKNALDMLLDKLKELKNGDNNG